MYVFDRNFYHSMKKVPYLVFEGSGDDGVSISIGGGEDVFEHVYLIHREVFEDIFGVFDKEFLVFYLDIVPAMFVGILDEPLNQIVLVERRNHCDGHFYHRRIDSFIA